MRTSTLRHVFDERLFDSLRAASRRYSKAADLQPWICEAHRVGWTWRLIADAARISPTTARRVHERFHAAEYAALHPDAQA